MSTDLQLRQDDHLPEIRLSSLKIKLPESSIHSNSNSNSTSEEEEESCTIQLIEDEVLEECRTPTAPENRIPEITVCPPAPKKLNSVTSSCKRRLSDQFQFFEIVAGDEVESFFKSSYEFIDRNSNTNKRRRCPLL